MKAFHRIFGAFAASVTLSLPIAASPDKKGVSAEAPAVSPTGRHFAFSADFDGLSRIWIANIDGTALRRISSLDPNSVSRMDTHPAWSPDGRRIAYESFDGNSADIWVMQADGANPVKLTSNGANNRAPAWSPDGKTLAFVSSKDGTNDIWLMNADGSSPRKLVVSDKQENSPSFSPDGRQVVFSTSTGEAATLMLVNVDGGGLRSLTSGSARDWNPNWGSRGIAFCSDRDAPSTCRLWAIQPDGTGARALGGFIGYDPAWLANGDVLYTDDDMRYSKALTSISVANVATGAKRVLIDVQGYLTPVDIRPGDPVNGINPKSQGKVSVAILSTRSFDAPKSVDRRTLTFGRTGAERSLYKCAPSATDVNGDGFPDLVCRFDLRLARFQPGDAIGVVRFSDLSGNPFEGRDVITTTAVDNPEDLKD